MKQTETQNNCSKLDVINVDHMKVDDEEAIIIEVAVIPDEAAEFIYIPIKREK